jgi:hypothetical protein
MLTFTQGNTTDNIVLTLAEKTTISGANYLMVLQHITDKSKVKKVLLSANDLSSYKTRYNEFAFPTTMLTKAGQYNYKVYEQASTTNTDETGLTEVENGKAVVNKASEFAYTTNEPVTTFKTYDGQ